MVSMGLPWVCMGVDNTPVGLQFRTLAYMRFPRVSIDLKWNPGRPWASIVFPQLSNEFLMASNGSPVNLPWVTHWTP